MARDVETIAACIVAEVVPKNGLDIGHADEALIACLRAAGCHISSLGSWPDRIEGRYDLVLCRSLDALGEDERRRLIAEICAATDEVLVDVDPAKPSWSGAECFAEHGFFRDVDFTATFRGAPLRFRRRRTRQEDGAHVAGEVDRLRETADRLYRILDEKDRLIGDLRVHIAANESTLGWKLLERLRPLRDRVSRHAVSRHAYMIVRRSLEVLLEEGPKEVLLKIGHKGRLALGRRNFLIQRREPPRDVEAQYQLWLPHHRLTDEDRRRMEETAARFRIAPTISILTVVDRLDDSALPSAIATMRGQIYPRWELCVATTPGIDAVATGSAGEMTPDDPRIRVGANDGVAPATATALELATGEFVGLLDINDALAPEALFEMVRRLNDVPEADILYSDEDALDLDGRRVRPFFKPAWSPDLLSATNYIGRFAMVRRRFLDEIGGFRPASTGGESYDLMLRAIERTRNIVHVPRVLYHRRIQVPSVEGMKAREMATAAECAALGDALGRRGLEGRAEPLSSDPHSLRHYVVRYRLRAEPLVSIIIPTRDKWHLLAQCIRSIEEKTRYVRYEVIVVDNESRQPETLTYLQTLSARHRVYRHAGRFNFSVINNVGVAQAKGEHLLFLNNDVEVIRPDWLDAMLEHAQRPDVGAVGAKLLYPDGRIQHGGVVIGVNDAAVHAFRGWPADDERGPRLCDVVRDCSAVTAACMLVPRRVFEEVGGFDERLRVVFQDVDLCLKIRERGYLIVYTPFALLYHYEGATRGRLHPTPDEKLFRKRWADVLARGDPYYNPNLTDKRDDWSLRLD